MHFEIFFEKESFFHAYARYTKEFPLSKKVLLHLKLSGFSTEIHNVVLHTAIPYWISRNGGLLMDIPGLSMRMAQSNLLNDVGTAMLAKSMEQAEVITASMTEMLDASAMELSVNPEIGANIDISV